MMTSVRYSPCEIPNINYYYMLDLIWSVESLLFPRTIYIHAIGANHIFPRISMHKRTDEILEIVINNMARIIINT